MMSKGIWSKKGSIESRKKHSETMLKLNNKRKHTQNSKERQQLHRLREMLLNPPTYGYDMYLFKNARTIIIGRISTYGKVMRDVYNCPETMDFEHFRERVEAFLNEEMALRSGKVSNSIYVP